MNKIPLMKFKSDITDAHLKKYEYPWKLSDIFLNLGEIDQMPGHFVFLRTKDDKIFSCYHDDMFERVPDEEA